MKMDRQIRKRIVLMTVFVSILPAGCSKEQPNQSVIVEEPPALDLPEVLNTDVIFPIKVGNWWKYETTQWISMSHE